MDFNSNDTQTLLRIMRSRRDVRGNDFLQTPVEKKNLDLILEAALCAPSVGYSQPWEFILIDDDTIKQTIHKNFQNENVKATSIFEDRPEYQSLKLEGIIEAPLNIAVLYSPSKDPVLGMTSMDKMGEYSVVCAIENMWLMARTLGIGMGWVSILDEASVLQSLNVPQEKKLIAYLCLGYVDNFASEPELKTLNWEKEKKQETLLYRNTYSTSINTH